MNSVPVLKRFATAAFCLLAAAPASAAKAPAYTLLSEYPATAACDATAADLQGRVANMADRYACDCDPAATSCWAWDAQGNIVGWQHAPQTRKGALPTSLTGGAA